MLRFGGSEILRSQFGKSIKTDNVNFVYEWVNPA
jgi:hypothetical protein